MKDFWCGFSNLKILIAIHLAMAPTGTKVLYTIKVLLTGLE